MEADHKEKRDEWGTDMFQKLGFMGNIEAQDLGVIEPEWQTCW